MNLDAALQRLGVDRRTAIALAALLALSLLSSLLQTPYRSEGFNHAYQIPVALSALDPGLYPGDRAVEASLAHPSLYWKVLVPRLGQLLGQGGALWVLFLLGRMFYVAGVFALGVAFERRAGPVTIIACAVAGLILTPEVGSGGLVRDYAEQTSFANGLLLGAIAAAVGRRWWLCLCLGWLASLLNLLYAVHAVLFVAPVLVRAVALSEVRPKRLGALAAGGAIAGLVAYVLLRPRLAGGAEYDAQLWIDIIKVNAFYHVDVFSEGNAASLGVLLAWIGAALCAAAAPMVKFSRRDERDSAESPLVEYCIVAWPLAFLALVASAAVGLQIESPFLVGLQGLRSADLLAPCLQVAATAALFRLAGTEKSPLGGTIASLLFAAFWLPLPLEVRILAPFAAVAVAFFWRRDPEWKWGRSLRWRVAFIAASLPTTIGLMRLQANQWSPARALYSQQSLVSPDWAALSLWARDNTPKDAAFLMRPYGRGELPFGPFFFRARSQRGMYVNWIDHTLLFFDPSYAEAFNARMLNLGINPASDRGMEVLRQIPILADDYALALAEREGLDYWIIPTRRETAFPVVAASPELKIVRFDRDALAADNELETQDAGSP